MFDWVFSIFEKIAEYFLDLFMWFFEFLFWLFDSLLRFMWDLARPLVIACLEAGAEHLPDGWIETIVDGYFWFQYINEWVPVDYAIKLFIAYYSIATAFYVTRVSLTFILPLGRV